MRLNSRMLSVTSVILSAWACAAISRSFMPIGWPAVSSSARMSPYSASASERLHWHTEALGQRLDLTQVEPALASQKLGYD